MASDMIQIARPAPPSVVAELSPIVALARALVVQDVDSDRIAQENGRRCRHGEKAIEEHFADTKRALIDAKRAFDTSVAGLIGPIAEEERMLMDAIDAEESGNAAEAEAILAQPAAATLITVAPAIAKVEGVAIRTLYSAHVHDVRSCLRFILERDEWLALLEKCIPVLETGLNPLARAQRNALAIPGVRTISTISRATR